MKEDYLHLLWQLKRLPFHKMVLINGQEFQIIEFGNYNYSESGPDFNNAKIVIDGLQWCGPVEMHIKSSDWIAHGHHLDPAYDNVIMHVVLENDIEIVQNGRSLPVLEVKSYIDLEHYKKFLGFRSSRNSIACANMIKNIDPLYINSMIDRCVVNRLERKYATIGHFNLRDAPDLLYQLLASAFGTKINSHPFEELVTRLPLNLIRKLDHKSKFNVVCYTSGLFYPDSPSKCLENRKLFSIINSFKVGQVNQFSWKYKGLRPSAFPNKRVEQFAHFVSTFDFEAMFANHLPGELHYFLRHQIAQINRDISNQHLKMSNNFADLLIINCFVPFVYWFGKKSDRPDISQNALELLDLLKSEENYITKIWRENGYKSKSALDSQGLIELYNENCMKKKCLNCGVGIKILRG